jgi:hypothetical protein
VEERTWPHLRISGGKTPISIRCGSVGDNNNADGSPHATSGKPSATSLGPSALSLNPPSSAPFVVAWPACTATTQLLCSLFKPLLSVKSIITRQNGESECPVVGSLQAVWQGGQATPATRDGNRHFDVRHTDIRRTQVVDG